MSNTEETLYFEQKYKEDLQHLRGFRLLDDDFMSKVFEDKACTEFLLQIILQKHDPKSVFCGLRPTESPSDVSRLG